jgi:hypothetical protein
MIAYDTVSGAVDNSMIISVELDATTGIATVRYRVRVRGGPVEEQVSAPFTVAQIGGAAVVTALQAYAREVIAAHLGV